MSKLNIDQQTIFILFIDEKSVFIPDYQRSYAWMTQIVRRGDAATMATI